MPPTWPPRETLGHALHRHDAAEIANLAALRSRLGSPDSILCLGNGPSSESAQVPKAFDRLFRVNWIWRARGFLTQPDVVFTADPDLPPPDSRAILGFPTEGDASRILDAQLRAGRAPAAWFAMPRLLPDIAAGSWPAYPTNGALMIAVAVALNPIRLVISGIDLYRHPLGKYPGPTDETNAYGDLHHLATDVDFIRSALSTYRGALTILSPALTDTLKNGVPSR